MKRSLRVTALIFSLVFILCLFSACGNVEPEETTVTTAPPTILTTMTTSVYTTTSTTVETTAPPESTRREHTVKTYSSQEVEQIVDDAVFSAFMNNYVQPPEGYPENLSTPTITDPYAATSGNIIADAYCVFGEYEREVFVVYKSFVLGPVHLSEICYCDGGFGYENWDRITYSAGEEAVDIFAIDRKHFIVLWDVFKNGYTIAVFEDGISPSEEYTYAPMYNGDTGELSFLFPEEEFGDDGYTFFQSVTDFYFEKIDDGSCRIVLEYEKDGVSHRRTAIYDINGIRPE